MLKLIIPLRLTNGSYSIILKSMDKVIIVNEDREFCQSYKKALEKGGFEVEVCFDGKVGLTRVLSQRPKIVILGIMLPTMNGFDVLEVLKKKETTKEIPVIVCSKLKGEEIEELKHLGASAFFPKSTCTPKILLEKIRELIG